MINRGKLYDITLLIIYFRAHRFPLFYNSAVKIVDSQKGASQQSPPPITFHFYHGDIRHITNKI